MSIDPKSALALAISSHKSIYALLLGSGVSRAAAIPTGWEVLQDLIRRLALSEGADSPTDIVAWYMERFGNPPDYSAVLEQLARTPAERNSLLREYFEPTPEQQSEGLKSPTSAHNAIARLVATGHIRVILTTNFDRLLERSLEAVGVSPTVVSSPDHISGMMPLPHIRCLVFKLHGDYLDIRIRNTTKELEQYDHATTELLDTILSQFGLVVCGWSVNWDRALADAILRNSRYRFSTFWMLRGKPSGAAKRIIDFRGATVVPIDSADDAFQDLQIKVEAISAGRSPDPWSPLLAVATMKKYLSERKYDIQLQDGVVRELNAVRRRVNLDALSLSEPEPDPKSFISRVETIESACAQLVPMIATGVYWDDGGRDELWQRCIQALAKGDSTSHGYNVWKQLQFYAGTLCLYAACIPALLRSRYSTLRKLLIEASGEEAPSEKTELVKILCSYSALQSGAAQWLFKLPENKTLKTPGSNWMLVRMKAMLIDVVGEDVDFEEVFDEFELIISLLWVKNYGQWMPGEFAWRRASLRHGPRQLTMIEEQIKEPLHRSPLLAEYLFQTTDQLRQAIKGVREGALRDMIRTH